MDAIILAEIGLLYEIALVILQLNLLESIGKVKAHYQSSNDKFSNIRSMLNHDKTEKDVTEERNILSSAHTAGIKSIRISKELATWITFKNQLFGELSELSKMRNHKEFRWPDNRLAVLQNDGVNKPVIELVQSSDRWPIDDNVSRSEWPYLVLTSPFAAKCAIEVQEKIAI